MRSKQATFLFGLIEISIGTITLAVIIQNLVVGILTKPLNVLIFVIASSVLSISLGAGIILRWKYARKLLLFFAGWIILSKILIFSGIIILNGALETTVPPHVKNIISILYHLAIILYFHQPAIKTEFEQ